MARSEITVIPNPLSYRFIDAGSVRIPPSLGQNPKLISVINGWGYWKNASNALIAFSHLRHKLKGSTYHLYGEGYQESGIASQWAISKGLADGVVFHGPVPHVKLVAAFKDATLMLHPSRWEACPMGIAEALALGLPVVGGKESGGVPWMIGKAGLLVDIDKPLEIANAALRLINDDVLYDNCVVFALQRVKEFSPELIAAQYEELYLRIMNQAKIRNATD